MNSRTAFVAVLSAAAITLAVTVLAGELRVSIPPVAVTRSLGYMDFNYTTDLDAVGDAPVLVVSGSHRSRLSTNVADVTVWYESDLRIGYGVTRPEAIRALRRQLPSGASLAAASNAYANLTLAQTTGLYFKVAFAKATNIISAVRSTLNTGP